MKQAWFPIPPGGLYDPIRKLWIEGNGWKRIAKTMELSRDRVRKIARELGLTADDRTKAPPPANGRRADEFQRDIMADLFAKGHGYKSIAKQLGMAHGTVVRTCRAMGLRKTERSGKSWQSPAYTRQVRGALAYQSDAFAREQAWVKRNDNLWGRHSLVASWKSWGKLKNDPVKYREVMDRKLQYHRDREKNDPAYRMLKRLRHRLWTFCKKPHKLHTLDVVGCTLDQLKAHMEKRFKPGMTWANHGRGGWQIDHIKPCKAFDLNDPHQQRLCFHFSNLRPMWERDNISKGDKLRNGMRARDMHIQLGLKINDTSHACYR